MNNKLDWTELGSLVAKIQSGQTEAWGELYEKITPYILSRTRYLLRNSADAEDATQEILIEIYKSISNLSDPQAFGGWLKTITLRRCYRYYGKPTDESLPEDNEGLSIDFIDDRQATPVEEIEAQETKDNLRLMIEALPSVQRETMILFYYDNLKIREIAEFMGCSENTVKSRLNYAKKAMETEIVEKRKKGIMFPAVVPWPLIFRQLFSEAFEESAGDIGVEVIQRIGERVASELGGMEGTEGLGGTSSGGIEGTGGVGGSVGSGATTAKGLAVATKTIIGIVAAVAVVAGAILLNQPSEPAETQGATNGQVVSSTSTQGLVPVTDSDYAHIYYDYIQEELKPTGNFIDADMVYLDESQIPLLITSGYRIHPKVNEFTTCYSFYEYNRESEQVEHVYTAFSSYGIDPTVSSYMHLLIEIDGQIHIGFLIERPDGIFTIETDEGTEERTSRAGVQLSLFSNVFTEEGYNPLGTSDMAIEYQYYADNNSINTAEEIQAVLDCRYGTWGKSNGEAVYFPLAVEDTNGERLRDYFAD